VNVCKDIITKRKKRKQFLTDFQEREENYNLNPKSSTNVFKEVMDELSYEELMKIINRLSEEDRLLIKLRDVDGLAYSEIADIVDKPVGTVKSKLHYARKRLRDMLEEVDYHVQ
jgi:RNA polymerase sigma-70 factor (ECF subfamily)